MPGVDGYEILVYDREGRLCGRLKAASSAGGLILTAMKAQQTTILDRSGRRYVLQAVAPDRRRL